MISKTAANLRLPSFSRPSIQLFSYTHLVRETSFMHYQTRCNFRPGSKNEASNEGAAYSALEVSLQRRPVRSPAGPSVTLSNYVHVMEAVPTVALQVLRAEIVRDSKWWPGTVMESSPCNKEGVIRCSHWHAACIGVGYKQSYHLVFPGHMGLDTVWAIDVVQVTYGTITVIAFDVLVHDRLQLIDDPARRRMRTVRKPLECLGCKRLP